MVLSLLFLWRLSSSPIPLNKLSPSIQEAVSNLPGEFQIGFEGIEIYWDRQENEIQLRATNVALADNSGIQILFAPAINISLSATAMMSRVIAVSAFGLKDVEIHLVRNEDGSLRLGKKTAKPGTSAPEPDKNDDSKEEFQDLTEIIAHAFSVLESSPDPQHPLSYLKTISIEGKLSAEDKMFDKNWQSNNIVFSFQGQENRIKGELSLSIDSPETLSGIDLDVSLLAHGVDITADIDVNDVQLSRLAGLNEKLKILEGVDMTVNGHVSGEMKLPDKIKSLELELTGGRGSVTLEQFFPEPLSIKLFDLKAKADPATSSLELSHMNLVLGTDESAGPQLNVHGNARSVNGSIGFEVAAGLEHLQIEDLASYWPAGLVPGTRNWLVENLKVGSVDKANLDIRMAIPSQENGALVLEELNGELAYSNLSVFFLRPMPAATGITGSGTFSKGGFDLSVESGQVKGIAIKSGTVQIHGMDVSKMVLDVNTSLDGGVSDALSILESPPFGLDQVIGFSSAEAGGQLTAKFGISLPLKSGLLPGEIKYQVEATVKQGSVQNFFNNLSLENADLEIDNDFRRLELKGSLDLAGIPIILDWNRIRGEDGELGAIVKVTAPEIKPDHINSLGYPVDKHFSGSIAAELDATIESGNHIDVSINADLGKSGLSIPKLQWVKPAGETGKASASVSISEGTQFRVKNISIEAGSLNARGEASYSSVSSVLSVDLASASLGQTQMNDLSILHDPLNGARINVGGGHLDLEPFIAFASHQDKAEDDGLVPPITEATESTTGSIPVSDALRIDFTKLDKVFFSQDRFHENVSGGLIYSDGGLQSIDLKGQYPVSDVNRPIHSTTGAQQGEFSFNFGPSVNGKYPLSIEVNNLGSLLATTLDNHMLSGGDLTIHGDSSDVFLKAPVSGSMRLDRFTVMDVPAFAQVLSIASLNQVLKTMQSEGLAIASFHGKLKLSGEELSSDLLRAHGGMIGATFTGSIDLSQRILDLRGSLIPLSRLNSAVSKIPLMSHVMGEDGQGIVALDYTITGSTDKPKVSVNPGSLLTPGALRHVFDPPETEQRPE